jgi:hypothetical protein
MELTNKKIQYTVNNDGVNIKLSGVAYLSDTLKVTEFNGSITKISADLNAFIGNFNWNTNNISINMQDEKEHLSEASQLVLDTIALIETQLAV